jgi:hypothetical protein
MQFNQKRQKEFANFFCRERIASKKRFDFSFNRLSSAYSIFCKIRNSVLLEKKAFFEYLNK